MATQRRRMGMSAESLAGGLEKTLGDGVAAVCREGERAREEQARALAEPERWLASLGSAAPGATSSAGGGAAADGTRSGCRGQGPGPGGTGGTATTWLRRMRNPARGWRPATRP